MALSWPPFPPGRSGPPGSSRRPTANSRFPKSSFGSQWRTFMDIPKEKLVLMFELMLKIRHFEDRVKNLFAAGELLGFVHLYLGQEAVAAGVCTNLRKDDYITS